MPALDQADLVAILGEDYQTRKAELESLSNRELAQMEIKQKIESLNNQKAPALYGVALGLLLIITTKWSASAMAATNQTIFAVGLIVISFGYYLWIRRELGKVAYQ